jgi:hypothetical protein
MAVRCGTCGLVAYYTPDRCPRCGAEGFDEVDAAPHAPRVSGGDTAVVFGLVFVAMLCLFAGALTLTVDGEPGAVRFLGLMTGVGLSGLCVGMIALILRPPPG